MSVIIQSADDVLTAVLQGEIDHHSAAAIRNDIDAAIESYRPKELILDFDEVTFMDSSGIGLVMGRYKSVKAIGGHITVKNTSAQIKKVMRLAGLDRLAAIE